MLLTLVPGAHLRRAYRRVGRESKLGGYGVTIRSIGGSGLTKVEDRYPHYRKLRGSRAAFTASNAPTQGEKYSRDPPSLQEHTSPAFKPPDMRT